jgi:hypothetical protein
VATKPKRIRWDCPTGTHPGILGPTRPPRDSIVRYCLPCTQATGRLVQRTAPALEAKRAAAGTRQKTKTVTARQRAIAARARRAAAETERFTVDGVDLRVEMARLVRLPVFGGSTGRLARRPPTFTVTRRTAEPRSRYGFAEPHANRINLSLWPGMNLADAYETLVHELCHLHHGGRSEDGGWHGDQFWQVMDRAFKQAYGVDPIVRSALRANRYHGRYAAALRRLDDVHTGLARAASEGAPS